MLGIVFTGASGVGKSTLARWASSYYMLPLLSSVTTDVYRERGTTFDAAFAEPDGGRRNKFLSDEWVYRVDGGIAYHLESRNIPHITLDGDDHRGRRASVLRAVDAIRRQVLPEETAKPLIASQKRRTGHSRGANWKL